MLLTDSLPVDKFIFYIPMKNWTGSTHIHTYLSPNLCCTGTHTLKYSTEQLQMVLEYYYLWLCHDQKDFITYGVDHSQGFCFSTLIGALGTIFLEIFFRNSTRLLRMMHI